MIPLQQTIFIRSLFTYRFEQITPAYIWLIWIFFRGVIIPTICRYY